MPFFTGFMYNVKNNLIIKKLLESIVIFSQTAQNGLFTRFLTNFTRYYCNFYENYCNFYENYCNFYDSHAII